MDEGPPKPVLARDLRFLVDRQTLAWTGWRASGWDVVKGDLGLLHASGGDFTTSLLACLESDSPDTESSDPAVPQPGEGFYYLVRARDACGQLGSYNDGSLAPSLTGPLPSQAAPRDPGIEASPLDCSCPACTPLPPLSVPSNVSTCAGQCQGMVVTWNANPSSERVLQYRIRYGSASGALH
ncbi:MAG: hypothetical protein DMF49_10200, partial [Acidobacteria bacterium]